MTKIKIFAKRGMLALSAGALLMGGTEITVTQTGVAWADSQAPADLKAGQCVSVAPDDIDRVQAA